jgi:hypothetical protein
LRAKPQRGHHASNEPLASRPPEGQPGLAAAAKPPDAPTSQLWLRGFTFGLVLWGLGLLALAVGADIPRP